MCANNKAFSPIHLSGKGPFQFLIKDIKEVKVCEHGLKQGVYIVRETENALCTQKSHMLGLCRVNQSWWQDQEDGPQFPLGQERHPIHRAVIESQNCFGGLYKIKASSPISSWQIEGGKVEAVTDFVFLGSKITVDCDCSHEIQRHLLLEGKTMTNLHSVLKSQDITLPTKVHIVKAMVCPIVMYGCESWIIKKAERQRIDAFELWFWRRLLRVPWSARRSNQSILKETSPS